MRNWHVMGVAGVALLLAGCPHDEYKIEMTDRQAELERTLHVSYPSDPESPSFSNKDELARIRKLYPAVERGTYTFTKRFAGEMPNDVGGHGTHAHFATPLGWASAYLERFRGCDDIVGLRQRQLAAGNRIIDILRDWLAQETAGQKEADKLRRFLDGDFRRDMLNLLQYLWLYGNHERLILGPRDEPPASQTQPGAAATPSAPPASQPASQPAADLPPEYLTRREAREMTGKTLLAMAAQYLVERKYCQRDDVPRLYRLFHEEDFARAVAPVLEKLLRTKAGLGDAETIQAVVSLLSNQERADESFKAALRKTPEYAKLLDERKKNKKPDDKPDQDSGPEPTKVFENLIHESTAFLFGDFAPAEITVVLKLGGELIDTNGQYDPKEKTIAWSGSLGSESTARNLLPVVCYATWAKANEKFQKDHFGKIVLEGEELVQYCLWHKSLVPADAAEWDAFAAKLKPGEGLRAQVGGFRFSRLEPAPRGVTTQPAPRKADNAIGLILQQLK